jgi:outer membrane protein assembly factor BamE
MQKVLTYLVIGVTLALVGCSTPSKQPEYETSALDKLPFVYKMTVQQGNIVTEEMVDRLEPGMTKSQVRFLLGTPMLTDLFHTNRWDYTYTIRRGHNKMDLTRLTVFFKDDSLVQVQGNMRPDPKRAAQREPTELLVSVPDWKDDRGFFAKAASKLGFESDPN